MYLLIKNYKIDNKKGREKGIGEKSIPTIMGLDFNVSYSGLSASQKMIKVSQNNIANAEVDGYARQRVEVTSSETMSGSGVDAQIGSGVISQQVVRIKDDTLISQSRAETSQVGYYDQLQTTLDDIEMVFGETEDGSISDSMKNFFNAWEEANKFPEEKSYRLSLLSEANIFANKLNSTTDQMDKISTQMEDNISIQVGKINDLTQKIAEVNEKINKAMSDNPNALLDERDRYINDLSNLTDVTVEKSITNPNLINIKSGGVYLVSDVKNNKIGQLYDSENNQMYLVANGTLVNPNDGQLKASLDIKNEYLPAYEKKLNDLTATVITQVNNYHRAGYGLDNSTGNDFFTGLTAGNIAVNSVVMNDTNKIALSSAANKPGNSDQGKLIASFQDLPVMDGGTNSVTNYYNGFVVQMGSDLNSAKDSLTVHQNVLTGINTNKQSVQGVEIDEEMTNLLQYQQFYQANAKMIKAVNDTFDTLFAIIQ